MGRWKVVAMFLALSFFLVGAAWSVDQGPQRPMGKFDPRKFCQDRFDRMDTDHDGIVTKEEFMAGQEEFFKMRDSDGDSKLSKEEFCPEHPFGMGGMGMRKMPQ